MGGSADLCSLLELFFSRAKFALEKSGSSFCASPRHAAPRRPRGHPRVVCTTRGGGKKELGGKSTVALARVMLGYPRAVLPVRNDRWERRGGKEEGWRARIELYVLHTRLPHTPARLPLLDGGADISRWEFGAHEFFRLGVRGGRALWIFRIPCAVLFSPLSPLPSKFFLGDRCHFFDRCERGYAGVGLSLLCDCTTTTPLSSLPSRVEVENVSGEEESGRLGNRTQKEGLEPESIMELNRRRAYVAEGVRTFEGLWDWMDPWIGQPSGSLRSADVSARLQPTLSRPTRRTRGLAAI
jgi:hypothetical protein